MAVLFIRTTDDLARRIKDVAKAAHLSVNQWAVQTFESVLAAPTAPVYDQVGRSIPFASSIVPSAELVEPKSPPPAPSKADSACPLPDDDLDALLAEFVP